MVCHSKGCATSGARSRVKVPTFTLDNLSERFAAPMFLKIDVEGSEVMVLKGGQRMLAEIRSMMYFEVGGENADETSALLHMLGYFLI